MSSKPQRNNNTMDVCLKKKKVTKKNYFLVIQSFLEEFCFIKEVEVRTSGIETLNKNGGREEVSLKPQRNNNTTMDVCLKKK